MFDFDIFAKKVSCRLRQPAALITEVVNSKKNKELFHQKYCKIDIDLNILHKSDQSFSSNLSENVLCEKEGLYIIEQLKKNKIYLHQNNLGSYFNSIMSNGNLLRYFSPAQHLFYAADFADLKAQISKLAESKYADRRAADNVKQLNSYYADYFGWGVYPDSRVSPSKFEIQLANSYALFELVASIFNRRQAVLPKKDLFSYANNLYNLIKQLNYDLQTRKSRREIKRGNASLADIRICTVYRDNKVLVIEPKRLIKGSEDKEGLRRSAEMCHTYFGIYRTSLLTGQTVQGANWCTAVGPESVSHSQPGSMFFLNKYLFLNGNNLYYFVDLQEDKIYALRTSGSDPEGIAKAEMRKKEFPDDPERSFRRIMMACTEEVTSAMGSSLGSPLDLLQKFDLTDKWAQKYIKFVNEPQQLTKQETDGESNLI